MTATQQIAREARLVLFEKLAKQKVLQVQSATEPPKRIEAGERAVAVDGSDYLFWMAKERGLADRGRASCRGHAAICNPMGDLQVGAQPQRRASAGDCWIMSGEGQEFIVNLSGQYPANRQVKAEGGTAARWPRSKTCRRIRWRSSTGRGQTKAQYARLLQGMTVILPRRTRAVGSRAKRGILSSGLKQRSLASLGDDRARGCSTLAPHSFAVARCSRS